MSDETPIQLGNVITIDDERIKNHLNWVVRGRMEETLDACGMRRRIGYAIRNITSAAAQRGTPRHHSRKDELPR